MTDAELIADYASVGDWMAACAIAQRMKHLRSDRALPCNLLVTLSSVVEAFMRAGEAESSSAFVQELWRRGSAYARPRISLLQALAIIAGWRGETQQAAEHLEEAAALAEAGGFLDQLRQIDAARARLL